MRRTWAMLAAMLAVAALGVAGPATAAAAPPTLSAQQLTAKLARVINTGLPDAERAAELQGGTAALPTANNIAARMNQYSGMFDWTVRNASPASDRLNAELAVTFPMFGTRAHSIYWLPQDGSWKLSNVSACVIARDAVGTDCTI